jgi:predicted transcriptional regulator
MHWATRLRRLAIGEEGVSDDVREELRRLCAGFSERASRLAHDAAQAPNDLAERELTRLAEDHAGLGKGMREILAGRHIDAPSLDESPTPSMGPNHWARLVEDLQDQRAARGQLLELVARVNESDPELAAALESLAGGVETHLARLRSLIARADPHAID